MVDGIIRPLGLQSPPGFVQLTNRPWNSTGGSNPGTASKSLTSQCKNSNFSFWTSNGSQASSGPSSEPRNPAGGESPENASQGPFLPCKDAQFSPLSLHWPAGLLPALLRAWKSSWRRESRKCLPDTVFTMQNSSILSSVPPMARWPPPGSPQSLEIHLEA